MEPCSRSPAGETRDGFYKIAERRRDIGETVNQVDLWVRREYKKMETAKGSEDPGLSQYGFAREMSDLRSSALGPYVTPSYAYLETSLACQSETTRLTDPREEVPGIGTAIRTSAPVKGNTMGGREGGCTRNTPLEDHVDLVDFETGKFRFRVLQADIADDECTLREEVVTHQRFSEGNYRRLVKLLPCAPGTDIACVSYYTPLDSDDDACPQPTWRIRYGMADRQEVLLKASFQSYVGGPNVMVASQAKVELSVFYHIDEVIMASFTVELVLEESASEEPGRSRDDKLVGPESATGPGSGRQLVQRCQSETSPQNSKETLRMLKAHGIVHRKGGPSGRPLLFGPESLAANFQWNIECSSSLAMTSDFVLGRLEARLNEAATWRLSRQPGSLEYDYSLCIRCFSTSSDPWIMNGSNVMETGRPLIYRYAAILISLIKQSLVKTLINRARLVDF
ncbi:uncharacterized protein EDB91DRAFT_1085002 [Suillus paluster]|uniref:uncharacterized protein n=1 Tax=Suillus paluster TaxID=48578 RepID=UPI001B87E3B6|nr:uncharacterized protein EDB91DRAFT_1085002 [Suillus paluster]KAG1731648.1 hypothetical protein EDB91DRAFT_1085002 [Suillus paluster]